jgi:RNA polymerase sigma-70 factor (ECF subfamily)
VRPLLVNGEVGLILAPRGRLIRALRFTMAGEKIAGIEIIADPSRLQQLDLALLED